MTMMMPSQPSVAAASGNATNRQIRAMAWDPKSPAALIVPTTTNNTNSNTTTTNDDPQQPITALRMDSIWSHSGVGCNPQETEALLQLLEAHQAYSNDTHNINSSLNRSRRTADHNGALSSLLQSYRATLRECLCRWEDRLLVEQQQEQLQNRSMTEEEEPLELLKLVYAVTQLSEIFLVAPLSLSSSSLDYYEDTFSMPGAVTAATVRYLRHHHTMDVLMDDGAGDDTNAVHELMQARQPDQIQTYWTILNTLVRRGLLEEAWALLSRHSLFRRALDATAQQSHHDSSSLQDDYDSKQLEQDKEGFLDLRRLLLSAPLPGGRDEELDGGDSMPLQDAASADEELLLEGVPRSSWKLWETSSSDGGSTTDFPVTYHPRAATTVRQNWMQYLHELPSIHRLKRRLPQLESMLLVLSGNLKGIIFGSWAEALLAELIYVRPTTLPKDVHIRADRLMKEYPAQQQGLEDVLLSIMRGDAGRVMEAMMTLGGASGAALPATMTCLLCNIFMEADLFQSKDLQTELLQSATFAILSSLSPTNNNNNNKASSDVGVRMVVKLLLPHIRPDGDQRMVATLAETLERHTPMSDVEARNLLDMTRPLVERKSVRVLDGCASLVLTRYRHYLAEERPGAALHWLLVGIELEALVFVEEDKSVGEVDVNWQKVEASSVCYRQLVTWCSRTAGALLRGLLDEQEGVGDTYVISQAMVAAVPNGPLEQYASNVPEVKVLVLVLGIFDGMTAANPDWKTVARNITLCLQEQSNPDDGGIVSTVAPRSMHWDLVQLGYRVLQYDEKCLGLERMDGTPSFDVKGIQTLMGQLTIITFSREVENLERLSPELVAQMRLALGKGLMRAFVADNAKRKPDRSREVDVKLVSKVKAIDLGKHSLDTQELVVKKMLEI